MRKIPRRGLKSQVLKTLKDYPFEAELFRNSNLEFYKGKKVRRSQGREEKKYKGQYRKQQGRHRDQEIFDLLFLFWLP